MLVREAMVLAMETGNHKYNDFRRVVEQRIVDEQDSRCAAKDHNTSRMWAVLASCVESAALQVFKQEATKSDLYGTLREDRRTCLK